MVSYRYYPNINHNCPEYSFFYFKLINTALWGIPITILFLMGDTLLPIVATRQYNKSKQAHTYHNAVCRVIFFATRPEPTPTFIIL